jgi:hypothetical protein
VRTSARSAKRRSAAACATAACAARSYCAPRTGLQRGVRIARRVRLRTGAVGGQAQVARVEFRDDGAGLHRLAFVGKQARDASRRLERHVDLACIDRAGQDEGAMGRIRLPRPAAR